MEHKKLHMGGHENMNAAEKVRLWELRNEMSEPEDDNENILADISVGSSASTDWNFTARTENARNDVSQREESASQLALNSPGLVNCGRILESNFRSIETVNINTHFEGQVSYSACAPPVRELMAKSGICIKCYLPTMDCMCPPNFKMCPKYEFRLRVGGDICPSCLYRPGCSGCSFCKTCFAYDGCLLCHGCEWCSYCSNYIGCTYFTKCSWCTFSAGCSWCQFCVGRVASHQGNARSE